MSKSLLSEMYHKTCDEVNEAAEKLPYSGNFYIQKETDKDTKEEKFVLYVSDGGGHEWYKEFDSKKEALKGFTDLITKATKGFEAI